jgi:hypothetical protein
MRARSEKNCWFCGVGDWRADSMLWQSWRWYTRYWSWSHWVASKRCCSSAYNSDVPVGPRSHCTSLCAKEQGTHWKCLTIEDSDSFLVWQCLGDTLDWPASEGFRSFMHLCDGVRRRALEVQDPILKAARTELTGDQNGDL